MASNRTEREDVRMELAEAKADLGELAALAKIAHRHLGDPEGQADCLKLSERIQTALTRFGRYLDRQDDLSDFVDGRGTNTATLATLIEKRDKLDELIERKRGNNSHVSPLR